MADFVFAFDPALDRPIPLPDAAPPAVAATMSAAPFESLRVAASVARDAEATALVLFGRVLDPQRASPAQAADLRSLILDLSSVGCHTVWVTDEPGACNAIAQMLGEPRGLVFATPLQPVRVDIRGLPVEIACGTSATPYAASSSPRTTRDEHRVIVGWDRSSWTTERWDDAVDADPSRSLGGWLQPGCHGVWGSRCRPAVVAGIRHVPPLQPRAAHESVPGSCEVLSLTSLDDGERPGEAGRWRSAPTQRVAWSTVRVASTAGGDEELAATIWSALESLPTDPQSSLQIVRSAVECGTSVARRVRVAEISAETLARVRDLFERQASRAWCEEICADPAESLAPLGHARSGGRPGTTTSFASALADIVVDIEQRSPVDAARDGLTMPADLARAAGWLALELIESA